LTERRIRQRQIEKQNLLDVSCHWAYYLDQLFSGENGFYLGVYPMETYQKQKIIAICIFLGAFLLSGCQETQRSSTLPEPGESIDINTTIGSIAEVYSPEFMPVEGYGIVGGLKGTGSSECPVWLRDYFSQYILKQLLSQALDVEKFLNSNNTAVVSVQGMMPLGVEKGEYFDIAVSALAGTQTTSLEGGWLYNAELRAQGDTSLSSEQLAKASGPIFIDTIDPPQSDKTFGYVLAGGTSLQGAKISIALHRPDYRMSSLIRNKLIERFGKESVNAVSPSIVELEVPEQYGSQKQRFVSIVRSIYLSELPQMAEQRIRTLIKKLAALEDAEASEIGLETIGKDSLGSLAGLLHSASEEVRLRCARCMLNLDSDEGLDMLREIAMDKNSPLRVEALETITASAERNDAMAVSRKLLRARDFATRLIAYEQLRKLDDISIMQELIARNFFLEQVAGTKQKAIYVSRSGQPRIVLFGAPLFCYDNIFIRTNDGNIAIDAPAGQQYVSIIYKNPQKPNAAPIQLKSSFKLTDIIKALCAEPIKQTEESDVGLSVSYAEMIGFLKQMSEKGAIKGLGGGDFLAGPIPQLVPIVKK